MAQKYGLCPKCLEMKHLTKHHIYPKKYFKGSNPPLFFICRLCHDALERLIPYRKLSKQTYVQILTDFIREVQYDTS